MLRRDGLRDYVVRGGPEMDAAVSSAVRAAGGEVVEQRPARATIEQLFLDTYRGELPEKRDDADPRGR